MPFFDPKSIAAREANEPPDPRLHAPATARNREPIATVLERVLPEEGLALEIASGTGEHVAFFAKRLGPRRTWQPTDIVPKHLASIAAHVAAEGVMNVRPPLALDVEVDPWPVERADAVLAINLIHIAPWSACLALLRGAARALPSGGVLFLYGPFREGGGHTAESNARFDERLRADDPRWGVRDFEDVCSEAARVRLELAERVPMPANNLSLVFRRV